MTNTSPIGLKPKPTIIYLAASLLLLLALSAPVAGNTKSDFADDLRAALELHENSSSFEKQNEALSAFRQVTVDHPDEWLGHFWAAYEETQIARLVGMKRGEGDGPISGYLDRAQSHLDRARQADNITDRDRSSIEALQSLVFQFRDGATEDEVDSWQRRAERAMAQAARLDDSNPVVLVFAGIGLISPSESEGTLEGSLGAVALLRQAQSMTAAIEDRSKSTYFNSEWLPFWLPRAEKALAARIEALVTSD